MIDQVVRQAADIVAAYVSHNHLSASELPVLLGNVHARLRRLSQAQAETEPVVNKLSSTETRRSITDDYLTSFIDGRRYKTLRRHLGNHGLTPDAYRAKYGLPVDYPMTAPAYSARRSQVAKATGLGRRMTVPQSTQ